MTLHAEVSGTIGREKPLVLIHGFGGSAAAWDAVRAYLPDMAVIAYDLPGHGRSIDAEGRGGAGRMAKAILADLDARGLSSFHLAGHSMGGAVAALIAMRAGAKTASLTLVAPGGMGPEINADVLERFANACTRDEIRASMRVMVANGFSIPEPVIAGLAENRARPGALAALADTYASMFTETTSTVRAQGTLPMELLEQVVAPVTVIWGEDDAILPFHQMDRLPEHFRKIRLKGFGHMLTDECPWQVAEVLVEATGQPPQPR